MTTIIKAPAAGSTPAAPESSGFISGMITGLTTVTKVLAKEPTQYIDEVTVGRTVLGAFAGGIFTGARLKDKLPNFVTGVKSQPLVLTDAMD